MLGRRREHRRACVCVCMRARTPTARMCGHGVVRRRRSLELVSCDGTVLIAWPSIVAGMADFFGHDEGPLGEPSAPVPSGQNRSARGSMKSADAPLQQLQQPAKGDHPIALKFAARTTGRTCNCCGN